jgi:hypothetical protein
LTRQEATERWHAKLNVAHILLHGRPLSGKTKRFMEQTNRVEGTCRQADGRLYVEDPSSIGLRFVGKVEAESYGGRNTWAKRDTCGWFTDPDGYHSDDGDGLCWGVVYQLPTARRGKERMRFVAGYQFGGYDAGPTIDFSRIFTDGSYGQDRGVQEVLGAREASKHADDMARDAAQSERDYREEQQEEEDDELEDA